LGTSLGLYATVGSDLRRERIAVCLPASGATYNATECLRVEAAVATLWGIVYVLTFVAAHGAIVLLLGFAIPDRGAFPRWLPRKSKAGPGSADRAARSGSVPRWVIPVLVSSIALALALTGLALAGPGGAESGGFLGLIALTVLIAPFWDG